MKRFNQWLSIKIAKRPGTVILISILLFNVILFLVATFVLANLSLGEKGDYSFLQAAYLTITMILDAGCISYVIQNLSDFQIETAIVCLIVIFIGMISFTGAVIGYITNYISSFMVKADSGYKKLKLSDHIVILNWNSRASEIVNDLLYCSSNQNVVILVISGKERIEKEINERISDTINRTNKFRKKSKNAEKLCKVNIVVREGDVFSNKQLNDISLDKAKTVLILGNDINNTVCKFESYDKADKKDKGNILTVKTLMQVADITAAQSSADNQKIIVEITDDWTEQLVNEIIKSKQVKGKCNIIPVKVNQILGQLLSQFSITPELNFVYNELFSNSGATFYSRETDMTDEKEFVSEYLKSHKNAIPLTVAKSFGKYFEYYSAGDEKSIKYTDAFETAKTVSLNKRYWLEKRHVIILGHNSNMKYIMKGFESFYSEWNIEGDSILDIVIVDDKKSLEKMNYYKDFPFVEKTFECDIYDRTTICGAINEFASEHSEDTSILILSDDNSLNDDMDANAMANLIYVQEIISDKQKNIPGFDVSSMDVIVELIDPKNHDIVNNYSGYNVVISNRYISKMITQLGEKDSLFDFYQDILSFDDMSSKIGKVSYESKELYAKRVSNYFKSVPDEMTATEMIRAVYNASSSDEINSPAVMLGYVKTNGEFVLFQGDQDKVKIKLDKNDKIIVYSAH